MSVAHTGGRDGGGVATGEPDLWCTHAALRTLRWLDRVEDAPAPGLTARYLQGCRNLDGGYAWSRGMASDAWATYYCTQALLDLYQGHHSAERQWLPQAVDETAAWLRTSWSGDAYSMMPGQHPDIWATYFSVRTATEICGDVPDVCRLRPWLGALQTADGGLAWSPEHAARGAADVRACYYGVAAWRRLRERTGLAVPFDVHRLQRWVAGRQRADGGFGFSASTQQSCMWATYRAVTTLAALGARPGDVVGCLRWIESRRGRRGAFVRWPGYGTEDVWAAFSAVGAFRALGVDQGPHANRVAAAIRGFGCPSGGFTYREPARAGDALSTAAAILTGDRAPDLDETDRHWLESCVLPNEDGVMYMPGRGSEVRCTLWALAAGAFADSPDALSRIAAWIGRLQNPDGGFGYWEGRASDLVSTSSAIEILHLASASPGMIDRGRVLRFIDSCRVSPAMSTTVAFANVPGGTPTLRATAQALHTSQALGLHQPAAVASMLDEHRVKGGGFANEGCRLPDLLSTFEAVLTADRHGLPIERDHLSRFMRRVSLDTGTAWSPLAPGGGGPLADCLGALLRRRLRAPCPLPLPALALS